VVLTYCCALLEDETQTSDMYEPFLYQFATGKTTSTFQAQKTTVSCLPSYSAALEKSI